VRVLDPGHRYALAYIDGAGEDVITFVKRCGERYPGNVGDHAGTTMQELLRAIIDRCVYVNAQRPCCENVRVIADLRSALRTLEQRAARMHGIAIELPFDGIELLNTCDRCGHVACPHVKCGGTGAIEKGISAAVRSDRADVTAQDQRS
jgi:hypothetical protein